MDLDLPTTSSSGGNRLYNPARLQVPALLSLPETLSIKEQDQQTLSTRTPSAPYRVFLDGMLQKMIQAHEDHKKAQRASEQAATELLHATKVLREVPFVEKADRAWELKATNRWEQAWERYIRIHGEAFQSMSEAKAQETNAVQTFMKCKLLSKEMKEYVHLLFQTKEVKAIDEERRKRAVSQQALSLVLENQFKQVLALGQKCQSYEDEFGRVSRKINQLADFWHDVDQSAELANRIEDNRILWTMKLTLVLKKLAHNVKQVQFKQLNAEMAAHRATQINRALRDLYNQLVRSAQDAHMASKNEFVMKRMIDRPGSSKQHDDMEALSRKFSSSSLHSRSPLQSSHRSVMMQMQQDEIERNIKGSNSARSELSRVHPTKHTAAGPKRDSFARRHCLRPRGNHENLNPPDQRSLQSETLPGLRKEQDARHNFDSADLISGDHKSQNLTGHVSSKWPLSPEHRSNDLLVGVNSNGDASHRSRQAWRIAALSQGLQHNLSNGTLDATGHHWYSHHNQPGLSQEHESAIANLFENRIESRQTNSSSDLGSSDSSLEYSQGSSRSSGNPLGYSHSISASSRSSHDSTERGQVFPHNNQHPNSPRLVGLKQNDIKGYKANVIEEGLSIAFLKNAAEKLNSDREYFPEARMAIDLAAARYHRAKKLLVKWSRIDPEHNMYLTRIHSANEKARWGAYEETYKNYHKKNPEENALRNLMNFAMVNKQMNKNVKELLSTKRAKKGINKIKFKRAAQSQFVEDLGKQVNALGHQLLFHKRQMKLFFKKEMAYREAAGTPSSLKGPFPPGLHAAHAAKAYYSFNRVKTIEDRIADIKQTLDRLGSLDRYTKSRVQKLRLFPVEEKRLIEYYPMVVPEKKGG